MHVNEGGQALIGNVSSQRQSRGGGATQRTRSCGLGLGEKQGANAEVEATREVASSSPKKRRLHQARRAKARQVTAPQQRTTLTEAWPPLSDGTL
jgi:hypothetical protein